jgi:hypothetical protein
MTRVRGGLYASNGMTWLALLVVQRERCWGRFSETGLGWTSGFMKEGGYHGQGCHGLNNRLAPDMIHRRQ